jgi:fumarate hydratase subunit beta
MIKKIRLPLDDKDIASLKTGEQVLLTGPVFTGRDQAHLRFTQTLDKGEQLPVDLKGHTIYYVGPTPAKPGDPIGSAGPTTSGRMDRFTPKMLAYGLKGIIGKGPRRPEVIEAIKKHKAVYFVAIGGAGAVLAKRIRKCEEVAYQDLGPESVKRLEVEEFPVIVAVDSEGNDIFKQD